MGGREEANENDEKDIAESAWRLNGITHIDTADRMGTDTLKNCGRSDTRLNRKALLRLASGWNQETKGIAIVQDSFAHLGGLYLTCIFA